MHPDTARALGLGDGDWVRLEVAARQRAPAGCASSSPMPRRRDVVNTGMGWWLPSAPAPERGALDININAALAYDGPCDPVSGSTDIRGLACRLVRIP